MNFEVVQNDIMAVDAIVLPANVIKQLEGWKNREKVISAGIAIAQMVIKIATKKK